MQEENKYAAENISEKSSWNEHILEGSSLKKI